MDISSLITVTVLTVPTPHLPEESKQDLRIVLQLATVIQGVQVQGVQTKLRADLHGCDGLVSPHEAQDVQHVFLAEVLGEAAGGSSLETVHEVDSSHGDQLLHKLQVVVQMLLLELVAVQVPDKLLYSLPGEVLQCNISFGSFAELSVDCSVQRFGPEVEVK